MFSVNSSVLKGWKTILATGLAVLIVIILQGLGMRVGWSQERPQLRIEEELTKQEKIYGSRGSGSGLQPGILIFALNLSRPVLSPRRVFVGVPSLQQKRKYQA